MILPLGGNFYAIVDIPKDNFKRIRTLQKNQLIIDWSKYCVIVVNTNFEVVHFNRC